MPRLTDNFFWDTLLYTHVIYVISSALIKCQPNYTVVQYFPWHPAHIRHCEIMYDTHSGSKTICVESSLAQWGWVTVITVPNMLEVIHKDCKFST